MTGTLGNLPEGGVNIATSAGGNRIGDIGGSVATDVGKLDKREGTGTVRGKARAVKALSKVKGTLSQGEVFEVIQRSIGQVQACYEKQLGKNPGLAGRSPSSGRSKPTARSVRSRKRTTLWVAQRCPSAYRVSSKK
ncbi:MAG: hypothetical protein R3E66_09260 [bacterium]